MADIPTVSWDETSPAGGQAKSLGDDRIREAKTQIREVIDVDHDFPSSGNAADNGQHKQVTLQEQADLGTGAVGATIFGSQTVDGKGEACYKDEDNNLVQITKGGIINDSVQAKTGDLLSSSVSTARTGWTDVTATYTGRYIRISSSAGLGTGGAATHSHADTLAAPAHTHTGPSHTHTGPSHTHAQSTSGSMGDSSLGTEVFSASSNGTGAMGQGDSFGVGSTTLYFLQAGVQAGGTGATGSGGTGATGGASATALTGAVTDGATTPLYVDTKLFKKD